MAHKVFIFENRSGLYCSGVKYKNGVWRGYVINGDWYMTYDENTKEMKHEKISPFKRELIWVGDPFGISDYNSVINDAIKRYESGEPSNRELKKKPPNIRNIDDGIPF